MFLSIIIPAFNEEELIGNTINSVKSIMYDVDYEIIVADHSSTDNTKAIAIKNGAHVVTAERALTIGGVRNYGARSAKGDIFLFIDGDVELKPKWCEEFHKIKNQVLIENIITGSSLLAPQNSGWITKLWYNKSIKENETASYMYSGHLMVSHNLFQQIGGFSETLRTGEDSEFSQRGITKVNASVVYNQKLEAIHHGYPKTISEFFKRERWHGIGNYQHLSFRMSQFLILMHFSIILSLFGSIVSKWFLVIYPSTVLLQSSFIAYRRYKRIDIQFPSYLLLSYIMLSARGISLFDVLYKSKLAVIIGRFSALTAFGFVVYLLYSNGIVLDLD